MPLQFRKGPNSQRTSITPDQGEPLWTTDTHALYVGDGVTPGGIAITGSGGSGPTGPQGPQGNAGPTGPSGPSGPGSGGFATTSTLVNGSAVVRLNSNGTMVFPSNTIDSNPNPLIVQSGNTASIHLNYPYGTNNIYVTGIAASTSSAFIVNASGNDTFEPASADGYVFWGIGKNSVATRAVLDSYGGTGTGAIPAWQGRRARGTAAAPSAVLANDGLTRLTSNGFGTTEFAATTTARIEFIALENFTDSARGTKIEFFANAQGTTANPSLMASWSTTGTVFYNTGTISTAMLTLAGQGSQQNVQEPPFAGTLLQLIGKVYDPVLAYRPRISIDAFGTSTNAVAQAAGVFTGRRARGSAVAPTAVKLDDQLAVFSGHGFDGVNFTTASGNISIIAAEDFTTGKNGGYIKLSVMPIGKSSAADLQNILEVQQQGIVVYSTSTVDSGGVAMSLYSFAGISGTGPKFLAQFDTSQYSAVKYMVRIDDGSTTFSCEVKVLADGTNTVNTVYGILTIGPSVTYTFTTSMTNVNGQCQLFVTKTGSFSNAYFKTTFTAI